MLPSYTIRSSFGRRITDDDQIREDISPHHLPPQIEHNFFRTTLIPASPVRGDYLERHLDVASKIIILRGLFVAILSALVIGFVCAIFWMGSMRETMCIKDPPETKFGAIRRSWSGTHRLASLVNYHCINNTMSPIVVTLRCTYKRRWEIKEINNESCKCDSMPPPLAGTYMKYTASRIGSLVTYHCDGQFLTPPVNIAQCSLLKKWVIISTSVNITCVT